jgi:hypothetical protein
LRSNLAVVIAVKQHKVSLLARLDASEPVSNSESEGKVCDAQLQ